MSELIKIEGQHKLNGSIKVSGSKNTTVALIPAAVLSTREKVTIYGVPYIDDVDSLIELLEELNCEVTQQDDTLIIDPINMKNLSLVSKAVNKLRASYYFMGALLGKYKEVQMMMPGGCYLGPRPIDLHLKGFEALGATVKFENGNYIIKAEQLIGNKIYLDVSSVGATINIMLAAVYAKGKTTIENAAKEPEIIDVANMLTRMGAQIRGAGTSVISIEGVETLNGVQHEIIPDRIVAGTYLIIAAAMAEDVLIENIIPHHLEALISKLEEMGVKMEVGVDSIRVKEHNGLEAVDIQTLPYPGFATDLQQPLTTLLTQAEGQSLVKETIYAERFKHVQELHRMGAHIQLAPAQATINGPTELTGNLVTATDLRCGAALIVAGLIDEKLRELGAVIYRVPKDS